MNDRQSIFAAALALPAEERAELALHLLDSLDEPIHEHPLPPSDAELARRIAAVEAGHANLVPRDEALSRAHARLRTIRG